MLLRRSLSRSRSITAGWRSSLASVGIGLIEYNSERFQANGLDTPRESPRFNPFYESAQIYWEAETFIQRHQRNRPDL